MQDDGQAGNWWNLLRRSPTCGTFVVFGTRVSRSADHCAQFLQFSESRSDTSPPLAGAVSAVRAISHWAAHGDGASVSRARRYAARAERWFVVLKRRPTSRNCVLFGAYVGQSPDRCQRFLALCDASGPLPQSLMSIAGAVRATSKRLELELANTMHAPFVGRAARRAGRQSNPIILLTLGLIVLSASLGLLAIAEKASWRTVATLTGEHRRVLLPDGTSVELNTQSVLRYRFTETVRALELLSGEARFRVTHEGRPFVLLANNTSVRDIGTEFTTRVHTNGNVEVRVIEGEIGLSYREPAGPLQTFLTGTRVPVSYNVRVRAGYIANNDRGKLSVTAADIGEIERQDEWRQGKLSFVGSALLEAITEFNRYNRNKIEIADAVLESVVLSGGDYKARDPERFLSALLHVKPMRVSVMNQKNGEGLVYRLRQAPGPQDNPLFGARLDEIALALNLCNEKPRIVVEGAAQSAAVKLPIDLDRPEEFISALVRSRAVAVRREGDRVVITAKGSTTRAPARQ